MVEQFTISPYLVEYPSAIGACRRLAKPRNRLKFNGYDSTDPTISGPTGLARTSNCSAARQGCAEARVTKTQTTRPSHRRPSSTPCTHLQFTELATRPRPERRHSAPPPTNARRRVRPSRSPCIGHSRRNGPAAHAVPPVPVTKTHHAPDDRHLFSTQPSAPPPSPAAPPSNPQTPAPSPQIPIPPAASRPAAPAPAPVPAPASPASHATPRRSG
jgi:hypothetical protein